LLARRRIGAKLFNVIDGTIAGSAQPIAARKVNNACDTLAGSRERAHLPPAAIEGLVIPECCGL